MTSRLLFPFRNKGITPWTMKNKWRRVGHHKIVPAIPLLKLRRILLRKTLRWLTLKLRTHYILPQMHAEMVEEIVRTEQILVSILLVKYNYIVLVRVILRSLKLMFTKAKLTRRLIYTCLSSLRVLYLIRRKVETLFLLVKSLEGTLVTVFASLALNSGFTLALSFVSWMLSSKALLRKAQVHCFTTKHFKLQ